MKIVKFRGKKTNSAVKIPRITIPRALQMTRGWDRTYLPWQLGELAEWVGTEATQMNWHAAANGLYKYSVILRNIPMAIR